MTDERPSNKASEEALGDLHSAVAKVLTNVVSQSITTEDGKEVFVASAAHIAAAITFLKNNSITADPATNEGLKELNNALQNRRRKRKLSLVDLKDAEGEFERLMGAS